MKVKLALAILGVLVIYFLSGCQEVYQPSYDMIKADLAEAQAKIAEREAKIAELQAKLEVEQDKVTEIQRQLEAYQANNAELEKALEICRAEIATTEETPPPPSKPKPLQEEDFSYNGFEDKTSSVHIAILDATWGDNNTLTVSWELTNTCKRKIFLNLLSVKTRDQMWQKGAFMGQRVQYKEWDESGFKDVEDPVSVCPSLQNTQKLWPGETVEFDTKWMFGPLSKEITINFIVVYSVFREDEEPIKLERLPERPETSPSFTVTRPPESH